MKNNVTIQDIADRCGLSAMTVSRAFRKDAKINPETRKMILECAAQLGYLKGSRQGRPQEETTGEKVRRIQLIFGSKGKNPTLFHMRLLTSMEQQLAQLGYECIIRSSTGDYSCFIHLLDAARKSKSYATIILGDFPDEHLQTLLNALPGALLLDNSGIGINDNSYSSFSFDNAQAAFLAVNHLYESGRRKILLVNGDKHHAFSNEILQGYKSALAKNGLIFDENLILTTDFSANDAAGKFRNFLKTNGQTAIDAIFTNDEMASGIYKVLQQNHLNIPQDIAVCGCDNLPYGEQLYPELTTVVLDYDRLAEEAINHLKSKPFTIVNTKLPARLLIKQSSGKI